MAWRTVKPLIPVDMAAFANYFESTWIGTSSSDPLFSHDIWNQNEGTMAGLDRSSNKAEGWHNGFSTMMACSNPTIWKFLECLKKEQALTDVKLTKHMVREAPPARSTKWVKYDERLNNVIETYDDFDVMDFLKVVGHLL